MKERGLVVSLLGPVKLVFLVGVLLAGNRQSARVIEKCGFRYIKTVPYETRYGTVENSVESILYRSDYLDKV